MAIRRSSVGMTITELVVSIVLMSFCFLAISQLIYLNTYVSTKLTNKAEGQVGCSRAIRLITQDIRQSQMIGNFYGLNQNLFPDPGNLSDPYNSVLKPQAWPSAPWSSPSYALSGQTLILQQPAYFVNLSSALNGAPLALTTSNIGNPPSGVNLPLQYLDTVVYQVIPDPVYTGVWNVQRARFSSAVSVNNAQLRSAIEPPQTILSGLVGPSTSSGLGTPSIFRYLSSSNATSYTAPSPTSAQSPQIIGVAIDLETRSPTSGVGTNVSFCQVHAESYMKVAINMGR